MKTILLASLFITTGTFAQSLDVKGFKTLLTQRKAALEKVNAGMSKKVITKYKLETETGLCDMTLTSEQTILKIDGTKMIVHSTDSYKTLGGAACAGVEAQTSKSLFFEEKPSLEKDLAELDETASDIKSISKAGEIVTLAISAEVTDEDGSTSTENVTVKYDLSKSSFRNTVSYQDSSILSATYDVADQDVNKFDLSDILFCESAESDNCSQGNWSDILY